MAEPAKDQAFQAQHAPGAAAAAENEHKRPSTYAGLHEARVRASSASGQRRGGAGRRPNSGQQHAAKFFIEGQQAQLHPKPQGQYQPWQMWEQQQQMMMMQQQQHWQANGYPVFGQYATHDGSPHAMDPNAPLMPQLIQQGEASTQELILQTGTSTGFLMACFLGHTEALS